jgi:hypothetical protein
MNRTWIEWFKSFFILTYCEFIRRIRDSSIPIRQRQDFFYNHVYLFYDSLQENKSDLHFVSTMLCE